MANKFCQKVRFRITFGTNESEMKFRLLVHAVNWLIHQLPRSVAEEREESVYLWMDYACVHQTDQLAKELGVQTFVGRPNFLGTSKKFFGRPKICWTKKFFRRPKKNEKENENFLDVQKNCLEVQFFF